MSFIEIDNLYKKCSPNFSINIEHLEIDEGETLCLIGTNGAGKSTLSRILCGLVKYDSGSIKINGKQFQSVKDYGDILGYVQQSKGLPELVTLKEYLYQQAIIKNVSFRAARHCMKIAELSEYANIFIGTLSEGTKRKIHIMSAILNKPKILIMDEPTVGIDPAVRNDILSYISKLNKMGMCTIVSTHYLNEVEKLNANYAIMKNGSVIFTGKYSDISKLLTIDNSYELVFENDASSNLFIQHYNQNKISYITGISQQLNTFILEVSDNSSFDYFSAISALCFKINAKLKSIRHNNNSFESFFLSKIENDTNKEEKNA